MSDSSHQENDVKDVMKDTVRKGNIANNRNRKLMLIKILVLVASLTVAVGYLSNRSRAQRSEETEAPSK